MSYLDVGSGPVVLLLHGLTANADLNFVRPGIVDKIVAANYRVIAPDLRGHGASSIENVARSWPDDALARDQIALLQHLYVRPYAVVGYSLGSMVTLRLHLIARVGERLILGGMGDAVALEWAADRHAYVVAALAAAAAGEEAPATETIISAVKASDSTVDSVAGSLRQRMVVPPDLLATFAVPVLVVNGDTDQDNGSGQALAEYIPGARLEQVAGTHLSVVANPALADAIVNFLQAP